MFIRLYDEYLKSTIIHKPNFLFRLEKISNLMIEKKLVSLEKGIQAISSTGSTAPFIGLFGTVWGIMFSFEAIAKAQNTNLSVVAPGIAEALFVTALGLLVAIPAVFMYNKINKMIEIYESQMFEFNDNILTLLSYDFDVRDHNKKLNAVKDDTDSKE